MAHPNELVHTPNQDYILAQQEGLRSMLAEHGYDGVEVSANGDRGFVVELGEFTSGGDILASDLDDSLVAYTQTKEQRLAAMQAKAEELGLGADGPTCERLIEMTDRFARWGRHEEKYHIGAHKQALSYAMASLQGIQPEDVDERVGQIEVRLDEIKAGLETPSEPREDDPFYFRDDELVATDRAPEVEVVDDVFEPMYEPLRYDDTLDTLAVLGEELQDVGLNEVIFTYGEPDFQLEKVLRMLEARKRLGRPLNISQIWLTTVPKGDFIKGLLADGADNVRERVFGGDVHSFILLDDSIKELHSVLQYKDDRELQGSGVSLGVIRTKRGGTKYGQQRWVIPDPLPTRDHFEFMDDYRANGRDDLKGQILGALLTEPTGLQFLIPRDAPDEDRQLARLGEKYDAYRTAYRQAYQARWGSALPEPPDDMRRAISHHFRR